MNVDRGATIDSSVQIDTMGATEVGTTILIGLKICHHREPLKTATSSAMVILTTRQKTSRRLSEPGENVEP